MTDEELKALCESNARSAEANSSAIADLGRSMVQFRQDSAAFRNELRSWVNVHNQISDDQGAELADLRTGSNTHDEQVTALRDAANADRQAFVTQSEADRQAFREALAADRAKAEANTQALREALEVDRARADADRTEWQASFQAQMEVMRSQLVEMSRVNRRLDNLEQAS